MEQIIIKNLSYTLQRTQHYRGETLIRTLKFFFNPISILEPLAIGTERGSSKALTTENAKPLLQCPLK